MIGEAKLLCLNLRHLYQRRGCWFYYLFLAVCVLPMIIAAFLGSAFKDGNNLGSTRFRFVLPQMMFLSFFLNMFTGMLAGNLVRSVVTKPFSVCLPRYKNIPPVMIGIMAGAVNLIYVGIFTAGTLHFSYSSIFVFSIGVFIYINMAVIVLKSLNPAAFFGFYGFIGFYGFVAGTPLQESITNMLEANSLWLSAVLLGICLLQLICFNSVRLTEKMADTPCVDIFSVWNTQKAKRMMEYKAAKKREKSRFEPFSLFEKLFNLRLRQSVRSGIGLVMLGMGNIPSNLLWGFFFWLLFVIVLCYFPLLGGDMARLMFFALPAAFVVQLAHATRLPLLLNCGRKERFEASIWAGILYIFIIAIFLVLIVLFSIVIDGFMPSFTLTVHKGFTLDYNPLRFQYILVVFLTIPAIYAVSIKNAKLGMIVYMVMLYMMVGIMVASKYLPEDYRIMFAKHPGLLVLPLSMLGLVSYLIIRNHFIRSDLKQASTI
ncbi:MAG: hypothetical protein ACIAQZ_02625 [Sedimentisphaeraceae bacterium JB056]